jgi:hypothetical protein
MQNEEKNDIRRGSKRIRSAFCIHHSAFISCQP